ncbi:lipoyl(octanoyl) transferase LipB [Moheibacter sediminis]|uniref:Octanoyltransferase n=1 Tax=Moheibacter sediminis TaxID=1434700 RepID=A0A1W1Z162_9FLAO|nr:lipoyl(octanoyl) transferase LipB [Moheibacter sediminis]SMC42195.1 lipoyl(octanoyl) transferase [Moheibacter sediminis]
MNKVFFKDLGIHQNYQQTWDFQENLLAETVVIKSRNREKEKNGQSDFELTQNHLLFVEHPHVYTLGKSGHIENMLANEDLLKQIDATFVKTNRGGDITYHGPGQLVGYPIFDLDNFKPDIHLYMRNLEEVIIKTIAHYGLKGERSSGETGVWLDVGKPYARKICAMGVKASRWVTMHGFALNVNTDLKYFEYIIPCGIKDKAVTSIEREIDKKLSMEHIKEKTKSAFEEVFEIEIV